ncbi:MAG: hypothetical protein FWE88_09425 [Phycisphaerae bacterium]|nr:hypothetical protein [Phycisphaerae bacterium]
MRFVVLVMVLVFAGGCDWHWENWPWEPLPTAGSAGGDAGRDDDDGVAPTMHFVEVRILSVEVPVGVASRSEKLWSYLDEERAQAVRDATMAQNGIRLGVAPPGVWLDLQKVLQEMTGRKLVETKSLVPSGTPLIVTLKTDQGWQNMSTIFSDRTASVRDYPPGDNVLVLICSPSEMDYSKLVVWGVPQIRSKEKYARPQNVPGVGPTLVYESDFFTLDACTFQLMMASGEILVAGPGAESRRRLSVGRHFLVHQKDGLECETILVIVPTIRKIPVQSGRTIRALAN